MGCARAPRRLRAARRAGGQPPPANGGIAERAAAGGWSGESEERGRGELPFAGQRSRPEVSAGAGLSPPACELRCDPAGAGRAYIGAAAALQPRDRAIARHAVPVARRLLDDEEAPASDRCGPRFGPHEASGGGDEHLAASGAALDARCIARGSKRRVRGALAVPPLGGGVVVRCSFGSGLEGLPGFIFFDFYKLLADFHMFSAPCDRFRCP